MYFVKYIKGILDLKGVLLNSRHMREDTIAIVPAVLLFLRGQHGVTRQAADEYAVLT